MYTALSGRLVQSRGYRASSDGSRRGRQPSVRRIKVVGSAHGGSRWERGSLTGGVRTRGERGHCWQDASHTPSLRRPQGTDRDFSCPRGGWSQRRSTG